MTKPRILIVEDDAILINHLELTLNNIGYEVAGMAATGDEAIQMALAEIPDAILMDIRLRGKMSGIQAAEVIHTRLNTPIIYLTAFSDDELLQQAKLTDAYAYLAKPVRDRELRASLEMALYKNTTEQQLKHINQILRAVRDINQLINHENNNQRMLERACQILQQTQGYRFVWIGQSIGDRLKPLAHAGEGQNLISQIVASATPEQGSRLPGTTAARIRSTVVCEDMLHDDRYSAWRDLVEQAQFSSTVAVPIQHGDSLFGVLSVYSDKTNIFTAEELELLQELTEDIAFGLNAIDSKAEREKTEKSLLESEKRFSTIFNESPIPVLIIRMADQVFVDVNDAFQSLSGYKREEVIGFTAVQLNQWVIPDDLKRLEKILREQGIVRDFETTLRGKNGYIHDVLMSAGPIMVNGERYVVNMAYDITARKQHEIELHAIAKLSAALRSAHSRSEMLPVIVEQLVVLLHCDTVSIEMINPQTGEAIMEAAHGNWMELIGTHQKAGTGINNIIFHTRKPYITNDLRNDPNLVYPEWVNDGFIGCIGAPLIAQDLLIGYAWMGSKTEVAEKEVRLFTAVIDIAANAIHRATLFEKSMKDADELMLAYDSTLEGWAHALELRDQETEGHTRRVVQLTVELARKMGFGFAELENVRRGALLHDIGKMGIPDSVLLKPGKLNDDEWEIMRRHPEYAQKLLGAIDYLHPVLDIPYCHHEKWDGSGYPRGLKGEVIPFAARIFAIVDVWDALCSDRPYRKAWSEEKTLTFIKEQSGIHFEPKVVDAFLEMLEHQN